MDDIRKLFILPLLFYLTITSGLPPGLKSRRSLLLEDNVDPTPNQLSYFKNTLDIEGIVLQAEENNAPIISIAGGNEEKVAENSTLSTLSSTISENLDEKESEYTKDKTKQQSNPADVEVSNSGSTTSSPLKETTSAAPDISPVSQTSAKGDIGNETAKSASVPGQTETEQTDNPRFDAQRQTTAIPSDTASSTSIPTVPLRGKCNSTDQCIGDNVDCRLAICKCALGFLPRTDNGELCGEASAHRVEVPQADPTMIGVVIGLALMSVTLCIVLRLFAKARFRENRTIFNTPNPRLMNVSLLKGSKTLLRGNSGGGQRSRRGSQASIASGNVDGGSGSSLHEGNGMAMAGSSSHRTKPSRQPSTDKTNEATPTKPQSAVNRSKRQDSSASNV